MKYIISRDMPFYYLKTSFKKVIDCYHHDNFIEFEFTEKRKNAQKFSLIEARYILYLDGYCDNGHYLEFNIKVYK